MKSAILAVVLAAGVGGFVASGHAETLTLHPDAAKAASTRTGQAAAVTLPTSSSRSRTTVSGETGGPGESAATGDPVTPGGKSTEKARK